MEYHQKDGTVESICRAVIEMQNREKTCGNGVG